MTAILPIIGSNGGENLSSAKKKTLEDRYQEKIQSYQNWDASWNDCEERVAEAVAKKICKVIEKLLWESLEPGKKTFDKSFQLSKIWHFDFSSETSLINLKNNLEQCTQPTDVVNEWIKISEKNTHRSQHSMSSLSSINISVESSHITCNDDDYFNGKMNALCAKISLLVKEKFAAAEKIPGYERLASEVESHTKSHNYVKITAWLKDGPIKSNNEGEAQKSKGWFW